MNRVSVLRGFEPTRFRAAYRNLTKEALATAMVLKDLTDPSTLEAFATQAEMARMIGISQQEVHRGIDVLISVGWLTKHRTSTGTYHIWTPGVLVEMASNAMQARIPPRPIMADRSSPADFVQDDDHRGASNTAPALRQQRNTNEALALRASAPALTAPALHTEAPALTRLTALALSASNAPPYIDAGAGARGIPATANSEEAVPAPAPRAWGAAAAEVASLSEEQARIVQALYALDVWPDVALRLAKTIDARICWKHVHRWQRLHPEKRKHAKFLALDIERDASTRGIVEQIKSAVAQSQPKPIAAPMRPKDDERDALESALSLYAESLRTGRQPPKHWSPEKCAAVAEEYERRNAIALEAVA